MFNAKVVVNGGVAAAVGQTVVYGVAIVCGWTFLKTMVIATGVVVVAGAVVGGGTALYCAKKEADLAKA